MAPQTGDALTSVVKALRNDDAVIDALYVDTTPPSTPSDRLRIYPGDPAEPNDHPVEIAVRAIMSTSSTSKSVVMRAFLVECTIVAQEPWYERWQSLAMHDIFDAVGSVTILAPTANMPAHGMSDGTEGIEIEDDTARRVIGGRWQYSTTTTRY